MEAALLATRLEVTTAAAPPGVTGQPEVSGPALTGKIFEANCYGEER